MGFLSGLLDNLYQTRNEPISTDSDQGKSNVMTFSVGFTNPSLNFKSHKLNNQNYGNIQSKVGSKKFKIEEIKTANYNSFRSVRKSLMQINPLEQTNYRPFYNFNLNGNGSQELVRHENIFKPDATILANFNNYRFAHNAPLRSLFGFRKDEAKGIVRYYNDSIVTPSLFNPYFMVMTKGITPNSSLLTNSGNNSRYDTSDCSIRSLVTESYKRNSILGLAKYRYIDFMYCRDLGKIPNNRLITLRRFAYPVGDNIFQHYDKGESGDIGRLVTWFGNEENKLEDILNYSYKATWKELSAKIEEIDSREDSDARGNPGKILNSLNPSYNQMVGGGFAGGHDLFGFLGASGPKEDQSGLLRMYDKNKVYTPKNTIQDTHTYEGKLQFTHEFTLVFTYKLRGYDNINPRSAFLDLIGNVMQVTYRRGHFWGGDRRFIGPPQNTAGWQKANAMIDGAWDKAGSVLAGLATGSLNFGDIFGCISGFATKVWENIKGGIQNIVEDPKGAAEGAAQKLGKVGKITYDWVKKIGLDKAALGHLKNELGRPALYAMDSLLSGDNVGLWHVTIGNPKNPIAAMGNLILTNASVQHYGPLGIDDFPTEMKVTVTLKHARSRDAVEIGRMYTKGTNGIYLVSHGTNQSALQPSYSHSQNDVLSYKPEKGITTEKVSTPASMDKSLAAQDSTTPSTFDTKLKEVQYVENLHKNTADIDYAMGDINGIHINNGYAAQMDHYGQELMFNKAVLDDETA